MDQQFSLSWNNFHGNLTKGFAGLLGNAEFVDVTIAVDGHLLQAHKVILSICSPYFKKMFQLNPCQHPIIVLRDVTHKAMRDLLQFMYHGEVSVKQEDLTSFIGTAEVLQIKGLTNKESDEDNKDKEKNSLVDPHKDTTEVESHVSTPFCNENKDNTSNDDVQKQKDFYNKLQNLSNLKRKSEEFIPTYFNELLNSDKRPKMLHKTPYSKLNKHILQSNHYDNMKKLYEGKPVDITPIDSQKQVNTRRDSSEIKDEQLSENDLELKTECDDMDIIVTDPAVCNTPKNYDIPKDANKDTIQDYQPPQDSALSLVVSGCGDNQLSVPYKYIYSRKGHKQLVHDNFVYTKHSTSNGKTSWRCVQYFSLNRCPATIETIGALIYTVNHQHNHEDCYDKLVANNIYEMSPDSRK